MLRPACFLLLILALPATDAEGRQKPHRETALPSKDAAKLFQDETWKAVRSAGERLLAEKDTDFLVDTVENPPDITVAAFQRLRHKDKEKHFHKLVEERAKADKIQGVYILICKSPNFFYVGTTGDAHFPSGEGSKIRQTLTAALKDDPKKKEKDKEHERNDALLKAVKIALEAKGLEEKK
jgi:hypothetical protein